MSLIPADLRKNPQTEVVRSVRELAVISGRVTVGLAGFGSLAVSGLAVAGLARQPVALAVTRLERRGERIWGVPCRGVGAVQPEIATHYPLTAIAGGSVQFTNPIPAEWARVSVWGSADASGGGTWGPALPPGSRRVLVPRFREDGRRIAAAIVIEPPLPADWPVPRRISSNTRSGGNYLIVDEVWEVPRGAVYSLTGGLYGVSMSLSFQVIGGLYDWRPAVDSLSWAGTGVGAPWWGSIAATARDGSWVRRNAWDDWGRRIRYVPGAGTTRAVAVDQDGAVLTPDGFGAQEFLATDWTIVGAGEPAPMDVTDWVFSGPAAAVPFVVHAGGEEAEGSANPVLAGGSAEPSPPAAGDYVRMSRDGVAQWAPVKTFSCPVE